MIAAELRGGNKPSLNEALGWIGWRVDDIFGAGVGRLEDVWIDPGTGDPRWLLVNAGRFGGRNTLIPFDDATAGTGHVWVPYEREIVLGAPAVEPGAPLTDQVESELQNHYAMHARSAGADARARNAPGALGELRYREPDPSDSFGAPAARARERGVEGAGPVPASAMPQSATPASGPPGASSALPARPAPPSPASASRDPQPDGGSGPGAASVPEPAQDPGPATARPAAGWQHDYPQPAGPAQAGSSEAGPEPAGAGRPAPVDEDGRQQTQPAPGPEAAERGAGAGSPAAAGTASTPAAEPARQMVEIQLAGNLTIRGELVNLRIFTDSE